MSTNITGPLGHAVLAIALASLLSLTGCKGGHDHDHDHGEKAAPAFDDYGAGIANPDDLTPIPSITKAPADFDGKTVTVRGMVASVCTSAGCFLYLGEGTAQIKVDMHPNGFNVPPGKGAGQLAWATGEVIGTGKDPVIIATGVRLQEKKQGKK